MCHLSVLACVEIRDRNTTLIRLYLYFLSKKEQLPVKTAILRLIGNLCELKETAQIIALNHVLLEKVVNCLKLEDQKAGEQALRILRLLSKRSQLSKSVLRTNGCLYIAKNLSDLAKICDFVQLCLQLLLKYPNGSNNKLESQWIELILRCVRCSQELRSVLGETSINKILELKENKEKLTDIHCQQKPLFPAIIDQPYNDRQKKDRQFWPLCKDFSADPSAIDLFENKEEKGTEHDNLSFEKELRLMQKLVHIEIRLIAHFSHKEEKQSIFLINQEVITLLVQYISEAPEMDNRLARALRRLSCHQSGLPLLLEMNFQRIIISRLIRRNCLLNRYARPCGRCDVRRDFGRLLLSDHALLADSRMGEYILLTTQMDPTKNLLDSTDEENKRIYTLMAAVILIRQPERRSRFFLKFRPIEAIFDVFGDLLRKCSQNEISLEDGTTEGMFGSEFIQKLEYKDQFIFDSEEENCCCSQEDFIKFLLADKYLCTRLLNFLLERGLAARLITGQTLPVFLPLVLAIPTLAYGGGLKNICMLALLQYSNNSELLYTLRHISKCDSGKSKTKAIDSLLEMLHSFIISLDQCSDIA
uniref:Uncharacterized protein n=1 Tax=Meloidogyne javanica TaxID=6303 RepID=A0A915MB93_MELJA